LFRAFLLHELTREGYRRLRYALPLAAQQADQGLASQLNALYMHMANQGATLFADVLPVLQALVHGGVRMALLTNGPSDGQRVKLAALGIAELFGKIYISEEIGAAKPHAFQHVLADLGVAPAQLLMVGDSLHDDIEGARAWQINTLLLDRQQRYPHYEGATIASLKALIPTYVAV
jgi:putative hydrolase of the HAD superfamily